MTDRDDLVPQCISICKVPKYISYEILLSNLNKHFGKGTVKANTVVQGLEDDTTLCRWILLLNDISVVQKLLQISEEEIDHDGRYYTICYSVTVVCEIPEEWLDLPEEHGGTKPLYLMRQAGARQLYYDQSGPVSGFYENNHPAYLNPTGDQGQYVGTYGDFQHQGPPINYQGRPSQHQSRPSHHQGHPIHYQGHSSLHPGRFSQNQGQPRKPPPYSSIDQYQAGGYSQPSQAIMDQEIYMKKLQDKLQLETTSEGYSLSSLHKFDQKKAQDKLHMETTSEGYSLSSQAILDQENYLKKVQEKVQMETTSEEFECRSRAERFKKDNIEEDTEISPQEPRSTKIIVTGLPASAHVEYLQLLFEKKAGFEPISVEIDAEDETEAIIEFESPDAVNKVLQRQPINVLGVEVDVEMYIPEPDKPLCTIVVEGPASLMEEELLELYFENTRKSGGDTIDEIHVHENNVAYITYESEKVAQRVINKGKHMMKRKEFCVRLHIPEKRKPTKRQISQATYDRNSEPVIQEPVRTIEVRGPSSVLDEEILVLYFENKKKSGGGAIEHICVYTDVVYVTFENEVAKTVSERSHCIEEIDLNVSLYTQTKPPPKYDDRIFIKGLKSTTTKDCLFNFLEAKSGCTPQSLVHGEMEDGILVLFDTCLDFDRLDHMFKNQKLEGTSLKMSRVAESNCVLVSDLPINTTRDTVQFYFENHRRSGGGPVLNVDVSQEDHTMIVFFEDYKVAEKVSGLPHTIGKTAVKVDLYLPCIGQLKGDESEPLFKPPDPLVITGVEWQKIRFLLNSTVSKKALEKQLQNCFSKIIWPDKGSKFTELKLECILSPDMIDYRKLAKGWYKCTEKECKDFITNIILKILSVIAVLWDKVMSDMSNISIANPDAVAVFVDREQRSITIVGLKHATDSVTNDVQKIIKHVEEVAEKEKQIVKETITNIEPIKTKMLLASKFPTMMEDKYSRVKVKINQTKNEIMFEGLIADVRGVKVDMFEMINGFAHDKLSVSPMKAGLYLNKNVKDYIDIKLKSRKVTSVWEVEDSWLVIYTNIPNHILTCKGIIERAIEEKTITLSKASRPIMSSQLWQTKLDEINYQYVDRVAINVASDFDNVHICAIDEIVQDLLEMVNRFLRLNTTIEDHVHLSRSITKLLEQHHKSELEEISKGLHRSRVMINYGKGINGFRVQGTEDSVKKAKGKLQGLIDRVQTKDKRVRKPGLRVHMRSEEGRTSLNNIESSLKCVVTVKGDSDTEDFYETTGDGLYDTIPGDITDDIWQTYAVRRHAECKAYDDRKIYTVEGDMTEMTVDVLVNTADEKLGLTGGLAKVIVNKGGQVITNSCKEYIRKEGKLDEGEAFVSPGGNLKAKHIVHIVGPIWKQGLEKEEERLVDAVFRAMKKADIEGARSIAIPAISCGVYSFPVRKATTIIADSVKNFFREEQDTPIREVYLCDVKGNTVQMFTEALKVAFGQSNVREFPKAKPRPNKNRPLTSVPQWRNRGNQSDSDEDNPYTTQGRKKPPPWIQKGNSSDSDTDYEVEDDDGQDGGYILGNIRVIVKAGDITQEDTDCIVNSSNEHLDLSRGGVSRALMKKGGHKLKQEAKNKHNEILRNRVAMTSAPNLPSKKIIHVVAQESLPDWRRMIDKCLEMAENKGLASIAFPALGTGLSMEPSDIADTMVKAILDLQKNRPANLREVRFVVFQPRMVDDFTKAITKSQGATAKGAVYGKEPEKTKYTGAKKSKWPMRGQGDIEDDNQVTFTIYAMGQDIIDMAIKRLLAELERIVFTKKFTDTILPKLDENQRLEIKAIAKQHHLDCRLGGNELEISGISKNVIHVQDQIYSIMRDCDRQNQEVNEAELLSNIVQWFYIEITAVKQELVKYTKLINHRIEKSYKNTDKTYEFQDNDGDTYVVDFAKMEEFNKTSQSDTVMVIRRDLIKEGSFEAPTTWTDMKGCNLKVVALTAADQEYQDIATKFNQSSGGSHTITKLDRIQNKTLWQQYQARKNLLDSQNKPGHLNETLLWHGTAPEAMDSIHAHGFNRSYCGKNATAFGDGVYFAVQASYSASNTYSRPDASGVKRMYYCRVLTGEYTLGKNGMRVPPAKPSAGSSQAMYDSVANNVQSPGMYIIFNDTQAYPEYLIAFK